MESSIPDRLSELFSTAPTAFSLLSFQNTSAAFVAAHSSFLAILAIRAQGLKKSRRRNHTKLARHQAPDLIPDMSSREERRAYERRHPQLAATHPRADTVIDELSGLRDLSSSEVLDVLR